MAPRGSASALPQLLSGSAHSAVMAPQPECPQTTMDSTDSSLTANSRAASMDASRPVSPTTFPTFRTVNRSPGPLLVIRFGTTRESEQATNRVPGSWNEDSSCTCGRTRWAFRRW